MLTSQSKPSRWLDRRALSAPDISIEAAIYIVLFILALFSRFYMLERRVMSHDENSHVYYSWRYFTGEGFTHDPLMHGPLQFHLIAPIYFMFGDNDFTARIPAALFSIATVMFMVFYRRYLGKSGAIVAAILMLISPYMLFYGRYVRNEAFVGFFGVVMIWAILRYLETGKPFYLYVLTLVNVLHFTAKETSFIYIAQALLFLAGYFIVRLSKLPWQRHEYRNRFLIALMLALIVLGAAGGYMLFTRPPAGTDAAVTAAPAVPGQEFTAPPAAGPCASMSTAAEAARCAGAPDAIPSRLSNPRCAQERHIGTCASQDTAPPASSSPARPRCPSWTGPLSRANPRISATSAR